MMAAWGVLDNMNISFIETNTFSCCFKREEDLQRIIRNIPWSYRGSLIILQKWPEDKTYEEIEFTSTCFWAQIYNLPLDRMNALNAENIGNFAGKFISIDNHSKWGSKHKKFIRIRRLLDITKPLKTGFFLPRGDDYVVWIQFRYESLNDFCYRCGCIGHGFNSCQAMVENNGVLDPKKAFGPWLRAVSHMIVAHGKVTQDPSNASETKKKITSCRKSGWSQIESKNEKFTRVESDTNSERCADF